MASFTLPNGEEFVFQFKLGSGSQGDTHLFMSGNKLYTVKTFKGDRKSYVIDGEAKILSYLSDINNEPNIDTFNNLNRKIHIPEYVGVYFVDKRNELYKTFCTDNTDGDIIYFIIYEFVKGVPLSSKMLEKSSIIFSINLLGQMLYTIKKLHDNDISHRDIKPDNIIYDCDQNIFTLIDFGLSCSPDINISNRKCNIVSGTPSYILPNLMMKKIKPDIVNYKASDLYALGVILYQYFHKHRPYKIIKKMNIFTYENNYQSEIFYYDLHKDLKIIITYLILDPFKGVDFFIKLYEIFNGKLEYIDLY